MRSRRWPASRSTVPRPWVPIRASTFPTGWRCGCRTTPCWRPPRRSSPSWGCPATTPPMLRRCCSTQTCAASTAMACRTCSRTTSSGSRAATSTPTPSPRSIRDAPAVATIDDHRGLGLATCHGAMDLAIDKARTCGIGAVSVTNCAHFGAAAYWAHKAIEHGMIGVAMTVGRHPGRTHVRVQGDARPQPHRRRRSGQQPTAVHLRRVDVLGGRKQDPHRPPPGRHGRPRLDRPQRRHADHGGITRPRRVPDAAARRHPRARFAQGLRAGDGGRHSRRDPSAARGPATSMSATSRTTSSPTASTRSRTPIRSRRTSIPSLPACVTARRRQGQTGWSTRGYRNGRPSRTDGSAASLTTPTSSPGSAALRRRLGFI